MNRIARTTSSPISANNVSRAIRLFVVVGLILLIAVTVWQRPPEWEEQVFNSLLVTEPVTGVATTPAVATPPQWLQSSTSAENPTFGWDPLNPLAIPFGEAPNLPSIRVEDRHVDEQRKIYGGVGDKKHLGGFTEMDVQGISPTVWKHMIQDYGVHSLMDVGCGRGISTLWFLTHGVDILCVEGSHDAVEKSMLPDVSTQVVEHDYSRGPYWPAKTYDAVWSVEFLEHVNLQFHFNYIQTFRKAALIFATSSRWGGWHHTEVHADEWWIRKYEAYGFRYSESMTKEIRELASKESGMKLTAPNGENYRAQHIFTSMKVFVNPVVAALPQHAHLFARFGCYQNREAGGKIINRECGKGRSGELETPLDKAFYPLTLTPEMDAEWERLVKSHLSSEAKATIE